MRTGKRKRLAALLLCLCMMVGMLPLSGTASAADLKGTQDNEQAQEEAQPAKAVQAEEEQQTAKTITAVDALEGDASRQTAPVGTERSGLSLPDKLTGTVDGKEDTSFPVTWKCEAFDGDTPGEYTFTVILGEAYTTADNVTLPTVTVAVKAEKAPLMLRGAANDNDLYEIDSSNDWDGLQAWLNTDAAQNAVVRINVAEGGIAQIKIPNKNITIESTVEGPAKNLQLRSDVPVVLTIRNVELLFGIYGINLASGSMLKFEGKNVLTPSEPEGYGTAVHVPGNKALTLTGVDASSSLTVTASKFSAGIGGQGMFDTGEAAGTVNITGGKVVIKASAGAGIGGGYGETTAGGAGGTVNISGESTVVDITMTGSGAGIGGGCSDATGGAGGSTTITGGKVMIKATYGAGIGGGSGTATVGGAGSTVNISGASTEVDITVMNSGAGIGGGDSHATGGAGGSVTITGGKVTIKATAGAGIGGGSGITTSGAGSTVNISGADTVVDITMTGNGAGIGGGSSNATGGAGGSTTITGGKVTIKAKDGAGIGGGSGITTSGVGGTVKISGASTVVDITMTGNGAGIGGGSSNATGGAGGDVTITGGKVTIRAKDGAGIGGGHGNGPYGTGGTGDTAEISGESTKVDITITGSGAGIGGGGSAGTGGAGADVTITDGTVTIKATYGAEIGGGYGSTSNGTGGTLAIDSTGTNRTVLDMQNKGTNAVLDHSIGTCQIKDATGALTGIYSKLTVTDGTADSDHEQKGYWKQRTFKNGSKVELTADTPPQGKYFSKWTADPALTFANAEAAVTSFTMPQTAQTVTANYAQEAAPAISGDTSKDVTFGYGAVSTDVYTVTGGPKPTVTQDEDYGGKIIWNDTTKKLDIAEGLDAGEYPVELTASNGVEPDATLTFTLTVEGIAPVITAQPKGAGYTAGQAAAPLAVAAEAKDGGTLSYQWYKNRADSSTDGTKIDNATDAEYKPDTGEAGTLYYYCVVTSTYGGQVPSLSTVSGTAAVSVTIPSHEVIPGPDDGKPLDLTKDAVFAFEGEFANVAAIRINGHALTQTPVSGTQAGLSGYPGYASELGNMKAGSVIVTLYKEFLQTLPDGTYTLEVEFLDGRETSVTDTQFEIRQEKPKPAHDSDGSAATGDASLLWPWVLLMLAALAGGALATGRRRGIQKKHR